MMRLSDDEAWLVRHLLDNLPEPQLIRGLETMDTEMCNDLRDILDKLMEALRR
jgi:hypothetical protein